MLFVDGWNSMVFLIFSGWFGFVSEPDGLPEILQIYMGFYLPGTGRKERAVEWLECGEANQNGV